MMVSIKRGPYVNSVQEKTIRKLGFTSRLTCHVMLFIFICCAFFNTSVSFMKERLDQDSMGIILLQNFLKEFFPGEVQ